MLRFLLPAVLMAVAWCDEPQFELAGKFTPEGLASVTLYGVRSPFTASMLSDEAGRFTFKKIEGGTYTIAILIPGKGEARRTIEVGPGTADAHQRVSLTLNFQDSDFEAVDVLRRRHTVPVTQLGVPEKAVRDYEDAQKDLARREVASAVKRLEHAVEIAPQFSAAWNNLGTIAYQTQNFPRAEECFRKALEADPSAFEPLVNLGGVLVTLNRPSEAWDYNVFAVLARPGDALANAQLGMTYFQLGDLDLAEKHFRQARQADPAHFSHPQLFLAEIHLRRGQRREAAADLEDFLEQHPDWPRAAKMRETIVDLRK